MISDGHVSKRDIEEKISRGRHEEPYLFGKVIYPQWHETRNPDAVPRVPRSPRDSPGIVDETLEPTLLRMSILFCQTSVSF